MGDFKERGGLPLNQPRLESSGATGSATSATDPALKAIRQEVAVLRGVIQEQSRSIDKTEKALTTIASHLTLKLPPRDKPRPATTSNKGSKSRGARQSRESRDLGSAASQASRDTAVQASPPKQQVESAPNSMARSSVRATTTHELGSEI